MTVTLWSTTARDGRQLPTLGTVARALIRSARHLPADPLPSAWKGGNYPIYSYLPLSTPSDLRFCLKPGKCRSMPFHVSLGMPRTCLRRWRGRGIPQFLRHMKPIPLAEGDSVPTGNLWPKNPTTKISKPIRHYRHDLLHDSRRCYGCNAIVRDGARDECEGPRPSAPTAPSSFDLDAALPGDGPAPPARAQSTGPWGARTRKRAHRIAYIATEWHPPSELPIWFHDCPHMGLERLRRRFPSCHDCWHATRPPPHPSPRPGARLHGILA